MIWIVEAARQRRFEDITSKLTYLDQVWADQLKYQEEEFRKINDKHNLIVKTLTDELKQEPTIYVLLYAFENYRGVHKRLYETFIQEGLELHEIEDVTQRWKLT